ncbi:PGF-CTERM sorting domain-containing protein [Halobacteriales archaeon QS_1_68_17]|nr:MAG: PGF-CTERM sorting domain-containing protein [Halobacteriales archaeon QS_1_68_17]
MQREALLAGVAVVVLAVAAVATVTVPGALDDPGRERERPGHVELTEMNVAAGEVSGNTATLVVDNRFRHRGGSAENVTLEVRAVDGETGFVARTVRREIGTVEDDGERAVVTNLTVERAGSYRLETLVYVDGQRVSAGGKTVRGAGTLGPLQFHRFDGTGPGELPVITYSIESVDDNRTTLNVSTYLTNRGDDPAGDVTLILRARQLESNIVADERRVAVGGIAPGRTATPGATLTVPDGYNYYLDAILVEDDVIVGTATAPARLDPTETIPENGTRREVGLRTGDFERGTGDQREPDREPERDTPRPTEGGGPGFGALAALVALLVGAILFARRRNQ